MHVSAFIIIIANIISELEAVQANNFTIDVIYGFSGETQVFFLEKIVIISTTNMSEQAAMFLQLFGFYSIPLHTHTHTYISLIFLN